MVVFDTSILLLLIHPGAKPPLDPETNQPVERAAERVAHLAKTLSDAREKVVVPTPVLSELLVHAGEATGKYLIHAHHDDYSKPLAVRWLCRWCHIALHSRAA